MIISNQQDNKMEHLNKRIQTVAVLGAGAVGCYLIAGLAPKLGENLWIIAEGSRKERLKEEGLTINDCQLSNTAVLKEVWMPLNRSLMMRRS